MKVPERILVRSVNWLGDAVMATPALVRLREHFPQAHLSLLTAEKLADLWRHHPAVDSVLMFSPEETVWKIGRQLREQQFDLALVLPNSPRSALECWLAGVPVRIGHATPWRRWFLTQAVPPRPGAITMHKRSASEVRRLIRAGTSTGRIHEPVPPIAHHIHQYLHLVAALGAISAPLPPHIAVTETEAAGFAEKFRLADHRGVSFWLGLNAGAEYGPAKRWPKERFIAAARAVSEKTGGGWIVFGGPGDRELAGEIHAALTQGRVAAINVAGETSPRELCAGLKLCRAVLTNDTGPMHLAAAVGTPVVVPFGSTSPELTGPGLPGDTRHRLIRSQAGCSPCFLRECPIDFRCMNGITVERVVTGLLEVLGRS
jgi:heptosyltransferase-2